MPAPHMHRLSVFPDCVSQLHAARLRPLGTEPLVSVLIPNYNYARFLPEALDSLLVQSYSNWEAVVCDDGSSDGSREIISAYADRDKRIRYVFQANEGLAAALNSVYVRHRGDVVCLLDADDVFATSKIAEVVKAFQRNSAVGMVAHTLQPVSADGRVLSSPIPSRIASGWIAAEVLESAGTCSLPPASGLCFRTEVLKRVFPLPLLRAMVDGYLRNIVPFETEVAGLQNPLAKYRQHDCNLTGTYSLNNSAKLLHQSLALACAIKDFLACYYGSEIAAHFVYENTVQYLTSMLGVYVMSGQFPVPTSQSISDMLAMLPSEQRKRWRPLLKTPRPLARIALNTFYREYPGKRVIREFLRQLR